MDVIFAGCVLFLAAGFVWFYVARPILEDYGVIRPVNTSEDVPALLMSRSEDVPAPSSRPSLETQNQTDGQTAQAPRIKAEELLTLYKVMRAAGIGRDDAAAAFKASGLPFNNNVWADAAPALQLNNGEYRTPIVGRPTSARFETDADFPYQAPA